MTDTEEIRLLLIAVGGCIGLLIGWASALMETCHEIVELRKSFQQALEQIRDCDESPETTPQIDQTEEDSMTPDQKRRMQIPEDASDSEAIAILFNRALNSLQTVSRDIQLALMDLERLAPVLREIHRREHQE